MSGMGGSQVADIVRELGLAMAAGAFPTLQQLEFGPMVVLSDGDLEALVQGMVKAPCARTLRSLSLEGHLKDIGPGFTLLEKVIGDGRLPALRDLNLAHCKLGDAAIQEFASSLRVATKLERLRLELTGIGSEGISAIAEALGEGRLGSQLRELWFGEDEHDDDDCSDEEKAALALAEALEESRAYLTHLGILHFELLLDMDNGSGAKALLEAAGAHCPALARLVMTAPEVLSLKDYLRRFFKSKGGDSAILHYRTHCHDTVHMVEGEEEVDYDFDELQQEADVVERANCDYYSSDDDEEEEEEEDD